MSEDTEDRLRELWTRETDELSAIIERQRAEIEKAEAARDAAIARAEKAEAELNNIYTDGDGHTWVRPSALAYSQTIKAIIARDDELDAIRDVLRKTVEKLEFIIENDRRYKFKPLDYSNDFEPVECDGVCGAKARAVLSEIKPLVGEG